MFYYILNWCTHCTVLIDSYNFASLFHSNSSMLELISFAKLYEFPVNGENCSNPNKVEQCYTITLVTRQ